MFNLVSDIQNYVHVLYELFSEAAITSMQFNAIEPSFNCILGSLGIEFYVFVNF